MPKSAKSFRENLRKSGVFFTPKKLAEYMRSFFPTEVDEIYDPTCGDGLFVREECDDIFRGMLRYSGISRFRAGVADKCVEWFAGGGKHWGNDEDGNADSVAVRVAI